MDKKIETTIFWGGYRGSIMIMEKKMKTTTLLVYLKGPWFETKAYLEGLSPITQTVIVEKKMETTILFRV